MTHKIAIQLHLVADSCTICRSRSKRLVRKFGYYPRNFMRRAFIKKMIVTQPVKKLPVLYEPQSFMSVFKKTTPLLPIMSHMNSVYIFPSHFSKIRSNIIFPQKSSCIPTKILYGDICKSFRTECLTK